MGNPVLLAGTLNLKIKLVAFFRSGGRGEGLYRGVMLCHWKLISCFNLGAIYTQASLLVWLRTAPYWSDGSIPEKGQRKLSKPTSSTSLATRTEPNAPLSPGFVRWKLQILVKKLYWESCTNVPRSFAQQNLLKSPQNCPGAHELCMSASQVSLRALQDWHGLTMDWLWLELET